MKSRPILFSAPMVKAILDGRKTQTRRVVRELLGGRGGLVGDHVKWFERGQRDATRWCGHDGLGSLGWVTCPYGEPGDRLWCKETIRRVALDGPGCAVFSADGSPTVIDTWPWKRDVLTAIYTPRGASRITLEVTDVRVHRLQEISEEDARAEGVEPYTPPHGHVSPEQRVPGPGFDDCRLGDQPHRLPFADLWDAINGKPTPMLNDDDEPVLDDNGKPVMVASRSWASNPWVWAITFRRLP